MCFSAGTQDAWGPKRQIAQVFKRDEEQSKGSGIRIGPNETALYFGSTALECSTQNIVVPLRRLSTPSRAGTEMFIHRLVLGEDYKNIRQITGTITGVSRNPHDLEFIDHVTVLLKASKALQLLSSLPIYYDSPDPTKDNRYMYSQRVDEDILQTLEEAEASTRSLVTEKSIPETFFKILDMLDEVKDTMTCSQARYPTEERNRITEGFLKEVLQYPCREDQTDLGGVGTQGSSVVLPFTLVIRSTYSSLTDGQAGSAIWRSKCLPRTVF
ncbi:hypothetical protein IW261DRAFT_1414724 [Armillaria novae-zelandiae]|uniref:Uncharacterized protein n=1 Tax=Armillaria novae-zelandiae TaxID=153914 RepID=A0AA39UIT4_9AGAR|nr:hypothetical protein IW261DRAFT_1414724 [Armillaria novae-zelandiae]